MKHLITCLAILIPVALAAQNKINPVIKDFGGIYDIPDATVKVDPDQPYHIVVDLYSGADDPAKLNPALNNVARMINLHAVSGADMTQMHVVLAVHAGGTYALMNNAAFSDKYGVDNINVSLVNALIDSGVKITICGQSMLSRGVSDKELIKGVEVATSMLTTVTTYQNKGYAFLRF